MAKSILGKGNGISRVQYVPELREGWMVKAWKEKGRIAQNKQRLT